VQKDDSRRILVISEFKLHGRIPAGYCHYGDSLSIGIITVVLLTDGVSEAGESEDGDSEEFGEERSIAAIARQQRQSAAEVLDGILSEVPQFSQGEQADDMTLIVAKGR
jgi:Stage II sporulation protein E (SpoIIE)